MNTDAVAHAGEAAVAKLTAVNAQRLANYGRGGTSREWGMSRVSRGGAGERPLLRRAEQV